MGFEIGQRWPEAVMHSWGSYFVHVPYGHITRIAIEGFSTKDVLVDFMPNLNIPLLGVKSFLGNFVLTIDYHQKVFSLLLP